MAQPRWRGIVPRMRERTHWVALAWLLAATAGWSVSFPLGKAVAAGLGNAGYPADGTILTGIYAAVVPLAGRFVLAALFLAVAGGRAARAIDGKALRHGTALGLFCGGGLLFQMTGLQTIDASVSAFLTQASVLLVPFLVAATLRRWPPARVWGALVLMLAGGSVLIGLDPRDLRLETGEWLTLVSAVLFALQICWLERPDYREVNPAACTLVMFTVVAVLSVVVLVAVAPGRGALVDPWLEPGVVVPVVLLTAVCTVAPFSLMNRWQREVSASEAGLLYSLESVFTAVCALFLPGLLSAFLGLAYPNERLTLELVAGGGLMVAANVWLQARWVKRDPVAGVA